MGRSDRASLLEPQSRFGDKPLKFQVVCPHNGTAVLKGLTALSGTPLFDSDPKQMMQLVLPAVCERPVVLIVVLQYGWARAARLLALCIGGVLLRGTVVNRTYGIHKHLYI